MRSAIRSRTVNHDGAFGAAVARQTKSIKSGEAEAKPTLSWTTESIVLPPSEAQNI